MNTSKEKIMTINIGPQHPSTHGVLRLVLDLDGEVIKSAKPVVGYLHRGLEKMAEDRTYFQYMSIVDRVDYLSSAFCSEAYCLAVEQLLNIEVPVRAKYIRVLLMELNRIASHLLWLGTFMLDLGASSPLFYCLREREELYNLFENLTGQRMMYNFHTFGGVKKDVTEDFLDGVEKFYKNFPEKINEYEDIITKNPIFLSRTKDIGLLNKNMALNYSVTGANLRASGVNIDFRKKSPYEVYDEINFDIPISEKGDAHARYAVRIAEMREALKIIERCVIRLRNTVNGEFKNNSVKPNFIKPENSVGVSYVESSRGLLSCMVYSDGTDKPYRVKWRTGSFYAVQLLPNLIKNHLYSDLMAILGSLDIVLPEVDR